MWRCWVCCCVRWLFVALDLPSVGEPLGSWVLAAACRELDTSLFYPKSGKRPTKALEVCEGCPVRVDCLEYALANHQHWGVWGGMTERQRFAEKRRRRACGED